MKTMPRFKSEKHGRQVRVFLHCSECNKRIREVGPREAIDVRRAYYCAKCDDGVTRLNRPAPHPVPREPGPHDPDPESA